MARRRRPPRSWYRTRVFRLVRSIVLTASLVAGAVWSAQDHERADLAGARTDARGAGEPGVAGSRWSDAAEPAPAAGAPPNMQPLPPLPPSRATRLAVPYLGITAPVVGLDLGRDRRMTAPPEGDPGLVGWYAGGPTPGESGTAVVVGHRDTKTGPAVFAVLDRIRPGRVVEARRADGLTAVYTVDAVRTYEKKHFPDEVVYGTRGRPELRLITCAGRYDPKTGYSGNLVVFAHLTETKGPGPA